MTVLLSIVDMEDDRNFGKEWPVGELREVRRCLEFELVCPGFELCARQQIRNSPVSIRHPLAHLFPSIGSLYVK
jgi:hypothetical protein